ncbi:MAG: glucosidase family protein [Anaerolineae bacterium]
MRYWHNQEQDDGAVHTFGNGEMLAFARGPNLTALAGPPYTSPDILSLTLGCEDPIADRAERETGAAIWQHRLEFTTNSMSATPAAHYCEFMLAQQPVYQRIYTSQMPLRWVLRFNPQSEVVACRDLPGAWLGVLRPGQRIMFYGDSEWHYHWVLLDGACRAEQTDVNELAIETLAGDASITIVGAAQLGTGKLLAEEIRTRQPAVLLAETRRYWADFTARRLSVAPALPAMDQDARQALDDAAVLLKTAQSCDGGLIAGPPFRYAYLRDGYGASRGLLALGMLEEARRAIEFRLRKFERFGSLQTAESLGHDRIRHVHENDEVETTSYMILQVRDYLRASADNEFGRRLWPLLQSCWLAPLRHLADGMLPFNGDETYVAGGFYPRHGLNHGSADSTLALIEAGRWLSPWARAQGLWTAAQADQADEIVSQARAGYRRHFFAGDRIWANEPAREELIHPPRFRHGVCANCVTQRFGWLERSASGRYLCPVCFNTVELAPAKLGRLELASVALLPAYLGADILAPAETRAVAEHVLAQAEPDGTIPSVIGYPGFVGYDPALLAINLTAIDHPLQDAAYQRLLAQRDRSGVWVEYYERNGQPKEHCCRARTWETGMSIDAITRYWQKKQSA